MPDVGEDAMPETKGDAAPEAEDEIAGLDAGPEGKFGMLLLAGEIPQHDPDICNPAPFDVVAVHGIHGDRTDTWSAGTTDDAPHDTWPSNEIHAKYPGSRFLSFGYDTSDSTTGLSTMAAIREKALQLLEGLVNLRRAADPTIFRPIVFIAHDLGGIIVKEALCIAAHESQRYGAIESLTRLLVFFGCPHRCTSTQDMEDKVASLLFTNKSPRAVGATKRIKELARSIVEINEAFSAFNMPMLASIVNVYSENEDATLRIFDKHTATFDVPFEERIGSPNTHQTMCKFSAYNDVYRRIDSALSCPNSPMLPNNELDEFMQHLRKVAAPTYPLESLHGPDHKFKWISQHQTYTEWLDSRGVSILHVHGENGASEASEYIFRCLDAYRAARDKNEIVVRFAFDRQDDRFNSVSVMLDTLVAQILYHEQNLYTAVSNQYEQMVDQRGSTDVELLLLFRNILSDRGDVLCVISGLDECDDSPTGFLNELSTFAGLTECRCKIVITTTADPNIQAALSDWPSIILDGQSEDPDVNLASESDPELLELMQQRPELSGFEKAIREKLLECGQDKHLRRLVLHQLRLSKCLSTRSATKRELELMPPTTPKDIFARILANIPSERRTWARKALTWTLLAFRPMRTWEMGVALALDVDAPFDETLNLDDFVFEHVVADLDRVFGGLFITRHDEVHFSHPGAREFLLAPDGEQKDVWYDVKDTAHQDITAACLFYLSLQRVQDLLNVSYCDPYPPVHPLESSTAISRYNLCAYAIKYWPEHYKLIPEDTCPTPRTMEFFQNTKALRCWAEASWRVSHTITRRQRSFLSFLPIFAGLGLQDLMSKWLDIESKTPAASQDRALALTEAARNSHIGVVRKLLSYGGYAQANLQDALIDGASCCDKAVLEELITYATQKMERFEWPPSLLCRAAQFGLEDLVRRLLKAGASVNGNITSHAMAPLHLAVRQGHVGVVKILLEYKADVKQPALRDQLPLHLAAAYGYAAVTKLLLDAGADINAVVEQIITPIYFACCNGNLKAAKVLAEAGCDMGDNKAKTEVEGRENLTPLHWTIIEGHLKLCRLLLENGADPNTSSGGAALVGEAVRLGKLEFVKLLVENGGAVDAVAVEGWSPLQSASLNGQTSIAKYLLDHGADINHTNDYGHTPILLAAERGFPEVVRLLADRKADLHCENKHGWTPIHLSYDHPETTRALIEKGADANRVADHSTPLFLATWHNYIEVVKVLLSFNVDLEIQCSESSPNGVTALSAATLQGNSETVRLLLEAGAKINPKSGTKNFAVQYAVTANREDTLRVLMEYHPDLDLVDEDGDTALNCLQRATHLNMIKLLVNGGSNLETRNNEGSTPLIKAVMCNNVEAVKYFIAKEAKLNVTDAKYSGPLHVACSWARFDHVKILVAAGSDVNLVVSSAAGTPLQSACRCRSDAEDQEMGEKIIRYLIDEAQADVTVVGGLQGCALNAACGWSTPEMVGLILEKGAQTDVEDEMGRSAVHYAAAQTMEHLQPILDAGADIEVRDKMGRTTLHWATIGGALDVVERVLSLSRGLVDQADNDGWTPLLWAARGVGTAQRAATSSAQAEIIKLLLDRDADPCVQGKGLDREWSPAKVARYHGVNDAVVRLLIAKAKEKLAGNGEQDTWDEAFHESANAQVQAGNCEGCLSSLYGHRYKCETCLDFDFCYKCYGSRELTHPGHSFNKTSLEYEPVMEGKADEGGDNTDQSYTDGDTDDTDDEDDDTDDENKKDDYRDSDQGKEDKDEKGQGGCR